MRQADNGNEIVLIKRGLLVFVVGIYILAMLPDLVWARSSPSTPHLASMHRQPFFWEVLAASVVGWVIGLVKGFDTTKNWLRKYWDEAPVPVVFALDMVIFVLVGGYFGTGIYNPSNFLEALAAGITWPVGLGALATK